MSYAEIAAVEQRPTSRRRHWWTWLVWLFLAIVVLVVLGVGFVLVSLKRVPTFYTQAREQLSDPQVLEVSATEFETQAKEVQQAIESHTAWEQAFTEQQINAWLIKQSPQALAGRSTERF
ncbi:MAG: hypothetical protein R3B90_17325 [Planctomycetaceae bacterium]